MDLFILVGRPDLTPSIRTALGIQDREWTRSRDVLPIPNVAAHRPATADWLSSLNVTDVALESTGVYSYSDWLVTRWCPFAASVSSLAALNPTRRLTYSPTVFRRSTNASRRSPSDLGVIPATLIAPTGRPA